MCGIIGYSSADPAANVGDKLKTGLLLLQHRGQDGAGIMTARHRHFFAHKGHGLVRDIFPNPIIAGLGGNRGVGHVRYPTSGGAKALSDIQPFYVNQPLGMVLAHNGNLTNSAALCDFLINNARRHINGESDSEILLNLFAHLLEAQLRDDAGAGQREAIDILAQVTDQLHQQCRGAYSVVANIADIGLIAFRDPYGIRPLVYGQHPISGDFMIASESAPLVALGFNDIHDVAHGEIILIDEDNVLHKRRYCAVEKPRHCIFEYIYLARPDSKINNILVYEARLQMARRLVGTIREQCRYDIDCVIPVPETARPFAIEIAQQLRLPYREGFVKNAHVGRTFIMSGQYARADTVRDKFNIIHAEFADRNVLLVDDSIVRGTTSKQVIQLVRDAGCRNIVFASAAPEILYPNIYGIDIPTRDELIAHQRSHEEIAQLIGVEQIIYQTLEDLCDGIASLVNDELSFETSCFDGRYIEEITEDYLAALEQKRRANRDWNTSSGSLEQST